jgi:hypothetical protein
VTTDIDTLATALYVKTDDLLRASPYLGRWRPAAGIAPKLSGAELVTLAVMRALLGFTSASMTSRCAAAIRSFDRPTIRWITFADPEGNEFDLIAAPAPAPGEGH